MRMMVVAAALAMVLCASRLYAFEPGSVSTTTVGRMSVTGIVDAVNEHGTDILVGASSDDIARYLPSGKGVLGVMVFVVRTDDGAVLVDTGFGRNIEAGLNKVGLSPNDITTVLITHAHGDHIGGLSREGAPVYPRAKVYIPVRDYEWSQQARDALAPYGDAVTTFEPDADPAAARELLPGIRPIAAYGHTPGHTVYVLESSGERMMITGDLVHVEAIQMPRPNVSMRFDTDAEQAAQTRIALLSHAASAKMRIAGMHLTHPGRGTIERREDAGEVWFDYKRDDDGE